MPPESATESPGWTSWTAAAAIAAFSSVAQLGLHAEAGLVGAAALQGGRAAVHPGDQPAAGQRHDVPADRHVGDPEQLDQVRDPGAAGHPDLLQDAFLPLPRQHYARPWRTVVPMAVTNPMIGHHPTSRCRSAPAAPVVVRPDLAKGAPPARGVHKSLTTVLVVRTEVNK